MRPKRQAYVPARDQERYAAWRARVLSWPAPVEPRGSRRISDMPGDWQERFIVSLLKARAEWADRDDFCHAYLEDGK